MALNLLQWNPHWECTDRDTGNCKDHAVAALRDVLVQESVDFANVVELFGAPDVLPSGWKSVEQECGIDRVDVVYNSARWQVSTTEGSFVGGCMDLHDRSFIVQQFNIKSGMEAGSTISQVIVVGAHYPHGRGRGRAALRSALDSVVKATTVSSVILLADTNEFWSVSSESIMAELDASGGPVVASMRYDTCCFNNGFARGFAFDRIIANFGHSMATSLLFDPLPPWARTGEFHKAVLAKLVEPTGPTPIPALLGTMSAWSTPGTITVRLGGSVAYFGRSALCALFSVSGTVFVLLRCLWSRQSRVVATEEQVALIYAA